jgi:hypothetical protein
MWTTILIVLVILILGLVAVVAMQPANFRISRSATMAAPPSQVFDQVNDFHNWEAWSPWAKLDPTMKTTYSGPEAGTGASYSWSGNNKVGEGRMTISESQPHELVRIQLEFLRPFAAKNQAEFTFQPAGNQTQVTWGMTGTNNFMAKAFNLVMNMDKLVGKDFEKGLAQLKTVVESARR